LELVTILIIVAVAAVYIGWSFYKSVKSQKNGGCHCAGCSCDACPGAPLLNGESRRDEEEKK